MKKKTDTKKTDAEHTITSNDGKSKDLSPQSHCKSLGQAWKNYKPVVPYSFVVASTEAIRQKNS